MTTPEFVLDQLEITPSDCRTCNNFLCLTTGMIEQYEDVQMTEVQVRDKMDLVSSSCSLLVRAKLATRHGLDMPGRESLPIEDCNMPSEYKAQVDQG